MVPYWISSILDEEFLQMSYEIPNVMITNDELISNNGIVSVGWTPIDRDASGEFMHNNVIGNDEYTTNNVVASDEFIPRNVIASAACRSNNVLECDRYNISNNVFTSVEYIPNTDLAIGFLSNDVVARGELLPKKEITYVDEIPCSGPASDEMLPNNGTVGDGPGAMVAGEALPNIASDEEQQGDSDDDLLREYDVDVSLNLS